MLTRHRCEPALLLLGLMLLGAALVFVMDALGEWRVPVWMLLVLVPAALVLAAFTALMTYVVRRRRARRREESERRGVGSPTPS